jgi:outer membrane immunogenic protein
MKYSLMLAAAVAGVLAAPAYAQDLSGFRVEARGGWEQVGAKATIPNPDDDTDEDGDEFLTASDNDSGISYGLEIGYDAQIGSSFVLGAYAGADFADSDICGEVLADDLACAGLGRTFTVGARAGVPIGERSLIYIKGGYSNGKLDASYDADVTDNDDDTPGAIAKFDQTLDGYHVGAGFELGVTEKAYVKLEYVYTDYGSQSWLLGDDAEADPTLKIGSDRHQVLAGVGLRF